MKANFLHRIYESRVIYLKKPRIADKICQPGQAAY